MKHWTKRWLPADKKKAYALLRWRYAFRGGCFALGIILMLGVHFVVLPMHQRAKEVQIISEIIVKYNPAFEPQWVKPTARYLGKNSGPFDPVWLAVVAGEEGGYKIEAESTAGAEGWFQNMPDKSKDRMARLRLEHQTQEAIAKLLFFYQNGFPLGGKDDYAKGTVLGMHGGYVGWRSSRGKPTTMEYMARIYCEWAQATGGVWKARKDSDQPRSSSKKIGKRGVAVATEDSDQGGESP